ncbi:unnamed protein product [Cylicostephanus goldi]|uniref:Glutathione S-transferase omega n=1 Tax=Cylicostephanus goldi TaxID=71465 RepID=A0A3P6RBK2_CYLGO|nr:unnamed protein product [Cylicostephanus goldi]
MLGAVVGLALSLLAMPVSPEIIGLETKSLRGGDKLKPPSHPLRLYAMRFCPWSERVLIYLAKKNIRKTYVQSLNCSSVEVVNVNLSDKPSFLKEKNPDERVPILEDNGKILLDSALICEYLDWTRPEVLILPDDPYLRAKQRMIAGNLEAKMPSAVRAIVEGQRVPSEQEAARRAVDEAFEVAERLLNGTYFGGSFLRQK